MPQTSLDRWIVEILSILRSFFARAGAWAGPGPQTYVLPGESVLLECVDILKKSKVVFFSGAPPPQRQFLFFSARSAEKILIFDLTELNLEHFGKR